MIIPAKLLSTARLDTHMAVSVDVLFDERVLGAEVNVEQRTRCLVGVWSALGSSRQGEQANEAQQARTAFKENILAVKAKLHTLVNHLLDIHDRIVAAIKKGEEVESDVEHTKRAQLDSLASALRLDTDASVEDIAASLHTLIFESKDRTISKSLRVLASPLTEYEQIRVAQSSLHMAAKQASSGNKNKKASLPTLASRLGTMMSMAMFPLECVEMLYREMDMCMIKGSSRLPLFRMCQEVLLLVAQTFPLLLTHPGTLQALLQHLTFTDDAQLILNTLQLLLSFNDQKALTRDKKTAAKLLEVLKRFALKGSQEEAPLAMHIIHKLWGPAAPVKPDASLSDEEMAATQTEGDRVQLELLQHHAEHHLSLRSDSLLTALACAARVAETNYPLWRFAHTVRRQYLTFLLHQLFPARDIVLLAPARQAALQLLQNYLLSFARSGATLDTAVHEKEDGGITPKGWFIQLLKVLKLDGRWPESNRTTAETLARLAETGEEEEDEVQNARYFFLLHTSYTLLHLCTHALYHRFFIHVPNEAFAAKSMAAPQGGGGGGGGVLSPKQAARLSSIKHQFHFPILAYMARHKVDEVARLFVEKAMQLLREGKLAYPLYVTIPILAQQHSDPHFVKHIKETLL